jgi:hypothetical protein
METEFIVFARQQQTPDSLQPGDFQDIFAAAGLPALSRIHPTTAIFSPTAS